MKVKVKQISRAYKVPANRSSSWPDCEHLSSEVRVEDHMVYDLENDQIDDYDDKAEVCLICGRILNWLGEDTDNGQFDWSDW